MSEKSGLDSFKILVVDDSEEDKFIYKRLLLKFNPTFEIHTVSNGQLGLDFLLQRAESNIAAIDLICLDVNMPVLDGWGFLAGYCKFERTQKARYLAMMLSTPLSHTAEKLADNNSDIDFYIDKPFKVDRIFEDLAVLIQTKKANH